MPETPIALVVAMTPDGAIGQEGKLPWDIPSDRRRFREITMGGAIIMGFTTFAGILGRPQKRPLDGRDNIVLTRNHAAEVNEHENSVAADSVEAALEMARRNSKGIYIIGGAQIYEQLYPLARVLHLTMIYPGSRSVPGDTYFRPGVNWADEWRVAECSGVTKFDPKDEYPTLYTRHTR